MIVSIIVLGPCQTSTMKLFCKNSLLFLQSHSIKDVLQAFKYAPAPSQ